MHQLITRNRAEAFRAANPTPAPAQLAAFLEADPHPLIVQADLSPGLLRLALVVIGAVVLGLIGWAL